MTLDKGAYDALAEAYPHAFAAHDAEPPLPPRSALIVDLMASLEPSSAACGQLTRAATAQLEAQLGHAPSAEECAAAAGAPQPWADYVASKLHVARRALADPCVAVLAVALDIGTPAAKYPEHAARYGAAEPSASDAEVAEAFGAPHIPARWKFYRGNRTFTNGIIARLVEALVALPRPHARLMLVGDPRRARDERHVPVLYARGGATAPPTLVDYPEFALRYLEADFSVVHLARVLGTQGLVPTVRAVDGDTLLALLLDTPRRARDGAATPCAMLRCVGGRIVRIDVAALHAAASASIDAFAGPLGADAPARPHAAFLVTVCMLLGNDYALKFLPKIGFVRLRAALVKNAHAFKSLVAATPDAELARDHACEHAIRIDRATLHALVDTLYEGTLAPHRPPAARVDVAHALLEYALNYFSNAANPFAAPLDPFALGASGLPLHGYELVDAAQPPSRTNVRHAARVHPRL